MDWPAIRENLRQDVQKNFDAANKMWFETLRLIITLSSSCLLITIAIADKLFPDIKTLPDISTFLVISWIAFFLTVLLAIIAKGNEIIFFGNIAREKAERLKKLDEIIAKKGDPSSLIPSKSYINNTIYWGVAALNSFFIGITALCLAFLERIVSSSVCVRILLIVIILLLFLNISMVKKRKT
jgi:hypothetical protein